MIWSWLYCKSQSYCALAFVASTHRQSIKHGKDFVQEILNTSSFIFMLVLFFVIMSPIGVYFRKVPKSLKIDTTNKRLEIEKRNKKFGFNTDKIRFSRKRTSLFYILEIHATVESTRNHSFEKHITTIIVPTWGLSWNIKKMNEIVCVMKAMNIEEFENTKRMHISHYFFD